MLGVRLDNKTQKRLDNLAKATGRSKSYYAKKAIESFLDEREELLLALAELEGAKAGEKTYTLEEVRKAVEDMDD
jgi:RHH-type rel operon transcriptional repressor/antitoxin RelB